MLEGRESGVDIAMFGGREIGYDESVLVPRQWTEAQSLWARELLEQADFGRVLEVCAGAGHIGLMAVADSDRALVQVDADVRACTWAWRNARAWGVTTDIRHGRMTEVLTADERFVVIIADPPWVPSGRVSQFPQDPVSAIDGGDDGLDVARECLDVIARHLTRDGAALLQLRDLEQGRGLDGDAAARGLTVDEGRQFEGGAVLLLRRSTEGRTMARTNDPNDANETTEGRAAKLADLTVDPQHDRLGEPGGENEDGDPESVPGVEGPEGVPDLPVPDDPGTGGPGTDDD